AAVGAELAVVLGANLALGDLLDVAAAADPAGAEFGEAPGDVDRRIGIGVGTAGVVDAHRRLAAVRVEVDLAHRYADAAAGLRRDMDLAAAADRAGGNTDGGGVFEFRVDVGHVQSLHMSGARVGFRVRKTGPPSAGITRIRFNGSRLVPLSTCFCTQAPRGWRGYRGRGVRCPLMMGTARW